MQEGNMSVCVCVCLSNLSAVISIQCPNTTHHESLLDACMASFNGEEAYAIKDFEVATLLAGRKGFLQDQALAQQQLGEYYLVLGKQDEAIYHIREAIRVFQVWGASFVADKLQEKHASLLAPVDSVAVASEPS